MKVLLCGALSLLIAIPAFSQDAASMRPDPENPVGENLDIPPGWEVRLDRPDPDFVMTANQDSTDLWFVTMTPGWHITAGPSAIYYHPANTASGDYTVTSTIHLFDPQGRNEGYGVIFGGNGLDADDQSYLYFLLRNDKKFLVKQRSGSETSVLTGWTESDVIEQFVAGETQGTATNTLQVSVTNETIQFSINGTTVHEMPAADHVTGGLVGLRINHGLNVHVSDLSVSPSS